MKKPLLFFTVIVILFFNTSCTKEEMMPIFGSSFITYNSSSLHSVNCRLDPIEFNTGFIAVDNFDPYEDAFADAVIKRKDSGFQTFDITRLTLASVGFDFSGKVKDLIKSCRLVATESNLGSTNQYVLATYDPDANNLRDNFTIEISSEELTQIAKSNLVTYHFKFEFNEPPLDDDLLPARYYLQLDYQYNVLLNPEK